MIRLFCKRALSKRIYSAKDTCNLKEPTNRSHPISQKLSRLNSRDSLRECGIITFVQYRLSLRASARLNMNMHTSMSMIINVHTNINVNTSIDVNVHI